MRRGIDGLATTLLDEYELDPYEDALFLFCGTKHDRFKALYWEGDGFLLLYKRFDNGKLKWPKSVHEVRQLSAQQMRWLLEGLSIDQPKSIKPSQPAFYC
jgi:transposase